MIYIDKSLCEKCKINHGFYRVLIMREKLTAIPLCKKCFNEWIELKALKAKPDIYEETSLFEKFLKQKKVKVTLI